MAARLEAVRERLVLATLARVAEDGWEGAAVAAIAARAGVAAGTVYRHFGSRDELLAEAFRRAAGLELERVAAAADGDGPPLDLLEAAVRTFATRALWGRRLAYALLAEPVGPTVEAERLTYRAGYRACFREVLDAAVRSGALDPHDTEVSAAAIVGAIGEVLVGSLGAVPAGGAAAGLATGPEAASEPAPTARIDALVAWCHRALPTPDRSMP